ncbi:MAG TPA: hypothetical protein VM076_03160 [Gemmatimonadaceae bacterium]|nr:hypothetical protein [Gemmatimonadaceae bacterium]
MRIPGELIPIVLFTMIPITVIGAPIARAIARRIERGVSGGHDSQALPNDVPARLERMEQAIDAIAVEVERIAEGQRFQSKLMAGREAVATERALARRPD